MLVEVVRAHTNLTKVSRVAAHDRSQSQPIRQAHTKAITQITSCYHRWLHKGVSANALCADERPPHHTHASKTEALWSEHVLLIEVDAVVVLATSVTATSRMLPVLANAAVAGADVSSLLPVLLEAGNLHALRRVASRGTMSIRSR